MRYTRALPFVYCQTIHLYSRCRQLPFIIFIIRDPNIIILVNYSQSKRCCFKVCKRRSGSKALLKPLDFFGLPEWAANVPGCIRTGAKDMHQNFFLNYIRQLSKCIHYVILASLNIRGCLIYFSGNLQLFIIYLLITIV
jgi:hypothetical protein